MLDNSHALFQVKAVIFTFDTPCSFATLKMKIKIKGETSLLRQIKSK